MTVRVKDVKQVYVDCEESMVSLHKQGYLFVRDKEVFVLSTDAIVSRLSELEHWEKMYMDEKQKTQDLKYKLRKLDLDMKLNELLRRIKAQRETEHVDKAKSSTSVGGRDAKGRFVKGHLIDRSRDIHGRFLKKSKANTVCE